VFVLFATFHAPDDAAAALPALEQAEVARVLRRVAGLRRGLVHSAVAVDHPFAADGPSPPLALQLYFDRIEALEAACGRDSPLASLGALPSLGGCRGEQQAMVARPFPVAEPRLATPGRSCSYLVHYPGAAADWDAWMHHYVTLHTGFMVRFPGIREVEVCSRVEAVSFLPWARAQHMQRNKVVWDDPPALEAALHHPMRHEMRADFHAFPPFEGGNRHFAMLTTEAVGSGTA
jgi:hypothetical protein